MFTNREDAAMQLADRLRDRPLHDPLILGLPRGGVVLAAVLARELGAEMDVVLARKLRAPMQPEYALGALSETGEVYLHHRIAGEPAGWNVYLNQECAHQRAEIDRRRHLYRAVRPKAAICGRSVIVTDDGIATGSTLIAALKVVRAQHPRELIVAVPVASPESLNEVRRWCDEVECLETPWDFQAIGQFYEDFSPVEDDRVLRLLRELAPAAPAREGAADAADPLRKGA